MERTAESISVERQVEIAASPETVWAFLVDPEKLRRWKGVLASFDARAGGTFTIEVLPGHTARGEIVEADPPRRLVYTWGWDGSEDMPPGSTTVEYELVPTAAGTTLRFTHRDLPSPESAATHTEGWDHYLPRLALAAAGGDPGPDPWARAAHNDLT